MIRIEEIVETVAGNHPQADLDLLRRAYLFSAREHKGQKRASGESYLVHPLEVANILANMKLDEVSVATGLLHDVVEDTLVDLDTIRKYYLARRAAGRERTQDVACHGRRRTNRPHQAG
jgi:GTP pyrophosphokinase